MHNSIPSISFAIFRGLFQHKYGGLIFCFATPLKTQCSATNLQLNFAKLQINFRFLSQNCNWIFSLLSSPDDPLTKSLALLQWPFNGTDKYVLE